MAYTDYQGDFGSADPSQVTPGAAPQQPKTSGTQIENFYNQWLGRGASYAGDPTGATAWNSWSNMDPAAAEAGIKNSDEAKAYAAKNSPAAAQASYSDGAPPIAASQGTNPALSQLRGILTARAGQSLAVDPNDPVIKAQSNAYGADQTRGMRQFLASAAEKAGPNANLSAEGRHAAEVAGRNTAANTAGLLGNEVTARRKEISDALSGLGGLVSQEDAVRLRQEDQDLARQQFGANTAQQSWEDQYKSIFG